MFLLSKTSAGQLVNLLNNETAVEFVKRVKPDSSEIAHPVIETSTWNVGGKTIIVFYSKPFNYSYEATPSDTFVGQQVFGYAFIERKPGFYQKILIDTFNIDTKLESVFFANADSDKDKEICVLTSNTPPPMYCKCDGAYYSTKIYDKPDSSAGRLQYMSKVSSGFVEFEGLARGDTQEKKATFKTAQAVKKQLSRLGYKQ